MNQRSSFDAHDINPTFQHRSNDARTPNEEQDEKTGCSDDSANDGKIDKSKSEDEAQNAFYVLIDIRENRNGQRLNRSINSFMLNHFYFDPRRCPCAGFLDDYFVNDVCPNMSQLRKKADMSAGYMQFWKVKSGFEPNHLFTALDEAFPDGGFIVRMTSIIDNRHIIDEHNTV